MLLQVTKFFCQFEWAWKYSWTPCEKRIWHLPQLQYASRSREGRYWCYKCSIKAWANDTDVTSQKTLEAKHCLQIPTAKREDPWPVPIPFILEKIRKLTLIESMCLYLTYYVEGSKIFLQVPTKEDSPPSPNDIKDYAKGKVMPWARQRTFSLLSVICPLSLML